MVSSNHLFIIEPIKERYIIIWSTGVSWKSIIEAIKIKSFQELSYPNIFVILFSLNPITKKFPYFSEVIPITTIVHNHIQPH